MLSDAIIDRNVHLSALVLSTEMLEAGGRGAHPPPQILADRLPLSQPEGTYYAPHFTHPPPIFQTFRHPCSAKLTGAGGARLGGALASWLAADAPVKVSTTIL